MSIIMIPPEFPVDKRNEIDREYVVFDALKAMPADQLTVVYSPRFSFERDECDFLLLHPEFGVQIFEVKNWDLNTVRNENGSMYVKGRNKISPGDQLRKYYYAYRDNIRRNFGDMASEINIHVEVGLILLHISSNSKDNLEEVFSVERIITEKDLRSPSLLWGKIKSWSRNPVRKSEMNAFDNIVRYFSGNAKPEDAPIEFRTTRTLPPGGIEGYRYLMDDLAHAAGELGNMLPANTPFSERCIQLLDRIRNDELRIGVFGVTGAGKSTFINALLERDILKTGLGETTRIITEIRATDKNHPEGRSEVIYKSMKEINDELVSSLTDYPGKLDGAFSIADESNRSELKQWLSTPNVELDEKSMQAKSMVRNLLEGWEKYGDKCGTSEESDFGITDELLHNREKGESFASYVAKRKIYVRNSILAPAMVLIDSPGFGSGIARHSRLALDEARNMDVILLISQVGYTFGESDIQFLRLLKEQDKTERLRRKGAAFIAVMNKIRRIVDGEDDLVSELKRFRTRLTDLEINVEMVHATDSACAYWAKKGMLNQLNKRELKEFEETYAIEINKSGGINFQRNYESSKFNDIKESLPHFLLSSKYKITARNRWEEFDRIASWLKNDIAMQLQNSNIKMEESAAELNKIKNQRNKCKREMDKLLDENFLVLIKKTCSEFMLEKKIKELATHIFDDEKRKSINDGEIIGKIPLLVNDEIEILKNELFNRYIELFNQTIRVRIINIISHDWPAFPSVDMMSGLEIEEMEFQTAEIRLKPILWERFLSMFSTTYSKNLLFKKYNEKIVPEIRKLFERNLTTWRLNLAEDVREKFESISEFLLSREQEKMYEKDEAENNRDSAKSHLDICHSRLASLYRATACLRDEIAHMTEPGKIINPVEIMMEIQGEYLSRTINTGMAGVKKLPRKEITNATDVLHSMAQQWKNIPGTVSGRNARKCFSSTLEEMFGWKEICDSMPSIPDSPFPLKYIVSNELGILPLETLGEHAGVPLSLQVPVLRQLVVEAGSEKPQAQQKQILILCQEQSVPPLVSEEREKLKSFFSSEGWEFIIFDPKPSDWMDRLESAISNSTIVHFAGHAGIGSDGNIEFSMGKDKMIPSDIFMRLESVPQLIWLNCCYGGRSSALSYIENAIKVGIKAVIGSNEKISDSDAFFAAHEFYQMLLMNKMTIGEGVLELRKKLADADSPMWANLAVYSTFMNRIVI